MSGKKSSHSFDEKRRRLLKFLGLGSAIFLSKPGSTQIRVNPTRPTKEITDLKLAPRFISINVLRQFDLLSLELRYYNFSLSGNILQKKGNPAYVVVVFQPQSMSEQAWKEEQNSIESPTVPGRMLIGGESRLVFSIPANISSIPLDVKELLAWEKYDLVVNERAKQPSSGRVIIKPVSNPKIEKIQKTINNVSKIKNIIAGKGITKDERQIINREIVPEERNSRADAILNVRDNITALIKDPVGPLTELETSLEIPMRLYLSPTSIAGWSHIRKLNADKGILKDTNRLFELWHTRMGTKTKNGNVDESSLTNEQKNSEGHVG